MIRTALFLSLLTVVSTAAPAVQGVLAPTQSAGGSDLPQYCVDDVGELAPSDPAAGDLFGSGVAVDGDVAVVGGEQLGQGPGAVRVFAFESGQWHERTKLLASDGGNNQRFGATCGLSGERIVVGAPAASAPGFFFTGAVYVFERDGTEWNEVAKILDKQPGAGDTFGGAIGLDGDVLAVGAPGDDDVALNAGSAQVFVRESTGWTLRGKLTDAAGTEQDLFGATLGVHAGSVVVGTVGSPGKLGAAAVYTQDGLNWPFEARLVAGDVEAGEEFGAAVDIHQDTVAVGAPMTDDGGAVYVFTRTAGTWSQQARLVAPDGKPGDEFGQALSLGEDRMVVGAPGAEGASERTGAFYVFRREGTAWGPGYRVDPAGADGNEEWSERVGLAGDSVLVTSRRDEGQGGARAYRIGNELSVYCSAKANSLTCSPAMAYFGCPSATADEGFVVQCGRTLNQKLGMLLYSVSGRDAVPFQGGTLCLASPVERTPARSSGGPPKTVKTCTGAYRIDLNAFAAGQAGGAPHPALRIPGTQVTCQWWARDPGLPQPHKTVLSNALEYEVAP